MADWSVDRGELGTASTKFTALKDTALANRDSITGLGLQESDFGRLHWIGLNTRVWEAYRDHTAACIASIEEMSNAIGKFGEGLHYSQLAYQGMEDASDEVAKKLIEEIMSGEPTK